MTSVKLEDIALVNPRQHRGLEDDHEIAFLGMADVSEQGRTSEGSLRPYAEVRKGYTAFEDRDLLVAKITPCFENGKIAQAELQRQIGFGSTEFHVVRPKPDSVDHRYLLHFLRSPRVRVAGERQMTGSAGQKRVPADFLRRLEIPLPRLPEQRRIAAILDEADALRAKRRTQLERLALLRSAAFSSHFGLPDRDNSVTIGDLLESTQYGTSSKAAESGDLPVLRMGNITTDGRLDLTDMKYVPAEEARGDRYLVKRGEILFNRTNSAELVGKTALYDEAEPRAFAGYLVRMRPKTAEDGPFIAGYLNSRHGKAVLRGMAKSIVGQANINAKEAQSIRVPIASGSAKRAYADAVKLIDEQRRSVEVGLDALNSLFASLQSRAFRGEL
ncbi:restriction endonuclease subunit S [Agromyces sp. MMS24-K17]|uniref:restriction endonuclease subunit S n=1 Tax=Agromyces sp. MMS24-K17 TaxID=3372850 RepID=UPI003754849D